MFRLIRYAYATGSSVVTLVGSAAAAAILAMLLAVQIGNVVEAAPQIADPKTGTATAFLVHVAVLIAVFALGGVQPVVMDLATRRIVLNLERVTTGLILRPLLGPTGIAHLEAPDVHDRVRRARGLGSFGIRAGIESIGPLIATRLTAISASVVVAWIFSLPVAIALLSTAWLLEWYTARLLIAESDQLADQTEEQRRSGYIFELGMDRAAKEIRVFGLAGWFSERHSEVWRAAMAPLYRERRRAASATLGVYGLHLGVMLVAVLLITRAAADGHMNIAEVATAGVAILRLGMSFEPAAAAALRRGLEAYQAMRAIPELVLAEDVRQSGKSQQSTAPEAVPPDQLVQFTDVTFTYPGSDRRVLDNLDFEIRRGERLALVGVNGAGKSTLVKLIHGLYHPAFGQITLDGHRLDKMEDREILSWQRGIVTVPQEFLKLPLSVLENVAFNLDELDSRQLQAFQESLVNAGAEGLVNHLPRAKRTVLDKTFEDGADLSGGEWQRLALTRALYALASGGAQILVLDEPAAALDVRAEADLVERYLELTSGVTSLVISHRFSVVRGADRICVMEGGRITESGSHRALMQENGAYARMFRIQSDRYIEGLKDD